VPTLPAEDAALFIRLHVALLVYANQKLGLVPGVDSEEDFRKSSMEDRAKIRDALYASPQLINSFVAENPAVLSPDELRLVVAWKQAIFEKFYILRHLKRYTVFLDDKKPPKAYGVLGIMDEIESVTFMRNPPILVETALLPWRDKIIYDGLVRSYNVYFGPGIRASLEDAYRKAKATTGIIETIGGPAGEQPAPRRVKKPGPSVEDLLAILDQVEHQIAGLKGLETPPQRGAFSMLRAAVDLARTVLQESVDVDEAIRAGRRLNSALKRLYAALDLK
jgi:hypothetical protein